MTNILAVDIGTKTGWAISVNGQIVHGVETFSNSRFSGGGMRYLKFGRWLNDLHTAQPFTEIVYEEVRRHLGATAAHVYGGFIATLTAFCEEHQIPYESEPVQTIKKFWTGKGNAGKPIMIATAQQKGFNVTDDNEADAIALLHLQLSKNQESNVAAEFISLSS